MASVAGGEGDAPPGGRSTSKPPGSGMGSTLAAGLCDAVGGVVSVSPHEDVRAYLQQTVLPVLGPAIEKLLHHIHESGELQRVLRERAAAEHEQRRRPSERCSELKKSDSAGLSPGDADSPAKEPSGRQRRPSIVVQPSGPDESPSSNTQTPTQEPPSRGRRPSSLTQQEEALAAATQAMAQDSSPSHGDAPAVVEPPVFDPLVWLSEQLRESALGDTAEYREQIEQLVMEQISASEAAILEEGLREETAEAEEAGG
mmetsp:Transcript_23378/g.48660  ORF Transcript_23378/g.48660 Transcript_23378/m.48660 type:complete len:257 (-) Transcript_23378:156-926(-)